MIDLAVHFAYPRRNEAAFNRVALFYSDFEV